MKNFLSVWIFFSALSQVTVRANVKVTVLYESLCPDSMRFIRKQLYPTYRDLKDHMEVELVPFGKARYATDPWRISCQHGPHECNGNAIQACAIARYPETEMQVNFVHCVMSENYPPAAGSRCARELNYKYDDVEECAKGEEGRQLLSYHGNQTQRLNKNLRFVPTILLDGEFNQESQRDILINLKSVVCQKLGDPLPEKCR